MRPYNPKLADPRRDGEPIPILRAVYGRRTDLQIAKESQIGYSDGHEKINNADRTRREMVTIKPKTVVTVKLHGTCASHSRTDVSVRDQQITIDEPEVRGGTNLGPAPTETLLAALIGCTNVAIHKIAAKNGARIDALAVSLEAEFDRRGAILEEEISIPFPEITMRIEVTTDAEESAIDTLKTDLSRFCPVSKVIRQSGTILNEVWTINRP